MHSDWSGCQNYSATSQQHLLMSPAWTREYHFACLPVLLLARRLVCIAQFPEGHRTCADAWPPLAAKLWEVWAARVSAVARHMTSVVISSRLVAFARSCTGSATAASHSVLPRKGQVRSVCRAASTATACVKAYAHRKGHRRRGAGNRRHCTRWGQAASVCAVRSPRVEC
jgi:hypothetical protein